MTGKELDDIRKKIGWTKRVLAKKLGVTETTVYNYIGKEEIPESICILVNMYVEKYGGKYYR